MSGPMAACFLTTLVGLRLLGLVYMPMSLGLAGFIVGGAHGYAPE